MGILATPRPNTHLERLVELGGSMDDGDVAGGHGVAGQAHTHGCQERMASRQNGGQSVPYGSARLAHRSRRARRAEIRNAT